MAKGIIGTLAPLLGLSASLIGEVEIYLRLASLAVGLAIGLTTLVSIIRGRRKP